MDLQTMLTIMRANAQRIRALADGIPSQQARWKPDPESWSILEVLCHLYDEEREDFRIRLDWILNHPGQAFPPIDPRGWVSARGYNQRDPGEVLNGFLAERDRSLAGLAALTDTNWATSLETPWGSIAAGDMLAAWAGHDLLHLRQLVELHWAHTLQSCGPFNPGYAGDW